MPKTYSKQYQELYREIYYNLNLFLYSGISTTLTTYMKNIDSGDQPPATVKSKKKAADYPIKSEVKKYFSYSLVSL